MDRKNILHAMIDYLSPSHTDVPVSDTSRWNIYSLGRLTQWLAKCELGRCLQNKGSAWSYSLLILHVNLDLVIDRVRSVLLVLRDWRLSRNHLHLHRARQK